jgi:hypothetical protein
VTEIILSVLFSGERSNGYYVALLQTEKEKERLDISDKVCFYERYLSETSALDSSSA